MRLTAEKELQGARSEAETLRIKADIAASFQRVAVQHLKERCDRAMAWARESHPNLRHMVVAGGVASNMFVREQLETVCREHDALLVCPPPSLCTDNGVMVAWAGIERMRENLTLDFTYSDDWLDLRPRWPLTERRDDRSFLAPRSAKKSKVHKSLESLLSSSE